VSTSGPIQCRQRLGGTLNYHYQEAALGRSKQAPIGLAFLSMPCSVSGCLRLSLAMRRADPTGPKARSDP
jgi:hypothetical protein